MANPREEVPHKFTVRGRTTKFNSIENFRKYAFGEMTREEYQQSSSEEEVERFEIEVGPDFFGD